MISIFDDLYSIIGTFFPSALTDIPFFNFLVNLFFFSFCCWVFSIFLIYPLHCIFKWFKNRVGGL